MEEHPTSSINSALLLRGRARIICKLRPGVVALLDSNRANPEYDTNLTLLSKSRFTAMNHALQNSRSLTLDGRTPVRTLGSSYVVKITSKNRNSIETICYLKSIYRDFPVPDVQGAVETKDHIYMIMSRASGVSLDKIWPQLTKAHKYTIQSQLGAILIRLRSISRDTSTWMLGDVTARCRDVRRQEHVAGGIRDEEQFNDFLCQRRNRTDARWNQLIRSSMTDSHPIVMTHGNLHPGNIMVTWKGHTDGDTSTAGPPFQNLRITSIIDWDSAGWYPAYWEYVKALNTVEPRGPEADWPHYLPTTVIGKHMSEFAIDSLITRWLE